MLAAVSWDGGGDGTNWSDPNNWSANVLPSSVDDVTINVVGSPTILLTGAETIASLNNAETLIIRPPVNGNGGLTLSSGASTNSGTLQIEQNTVGGYVSQLAIGTSASLVNAASGSIRFNTAATSFARIQGSSSTTSVFTNNGNINVLAGTGAELNTLAVTHAGTMTFAAATRLTAVFSNLVYQGGSNPSGFWASNTTLDLRSATAASTVNAESYNTFVGNSATNLTLALTPPTNTGGTLYVSENAANAGTILLQQTTVGGYVTDIQVASGKTLTNTGTIRGDAIAGSFARITGGGKDVSKVVNSGTLDAVNGTFGINAVTLDQQGTLSATNPGARIELFGDRLNYLSGSNTANVYTHTTDLNLVAAGTSSTLVAISTNTLIKNTASNLTVVVQGSSTYGGGTLNVSDNATNAGTIVFDVISPGGYQSVLYIATGATLTNSGTLRAAAGGTPSDYRQVSGGGAGAVLVNTGTISVLGGSLELFNLEFNQQGTLSIAAASRLILTGGRLNYLGGSNSDGFHVRGAALNLQSATSASTLLVEGGSNSLITNASANLTLLVQSSTDGGNASLQIPDNATNAGTIVLDVAVAGGYAASLNIAQGKTFTNAGTIRTGPGTSPTDPINLYGSGFSGPNASTLINSGTIEVNGLNATASSLLFRQQGQINVGAGKRFVLASSALRYLSGANTAGFIVQNTTLDLVAATAASTVQAESSNTFIGNAASNLTIRAQANSLSGNASLYVAADATNSGTILLDVIAAGGYASTISLATGITFTNAGTIRSTPNSTGGTEYRQIVGVGTESPNVSTLTNTGAIDVAGDNVTISSLIFNQQGTLSAASGKRLTLGGIRFNYLSGSNTAGVYASSSTLNFTGATSASTVVAEGANTLLGNVALLTIDLRAGNVTGNGYLSISGTATNAGTIVLNVVDAGGYAATINVGSNAVFTNTGTIRTTANTGSDNRSVNGTAASGAFISRFFNNGLIDVAGGDLNVTNLAVTHTGAINVASGKRLNLSSDALIYQGGSNQNGLYVSSCTLDIRSASSASRIDIVGGGDYLIGNTAANVTLALVANATDGNARLNIDTSVATNVVNNGTILLDVQTAGGYDAGLILGPGVTFTNAASGTIRAVASASGGTRTIYLSSGTPNVFNNAGTITLDASTDLSGQGNITNTGTILKNSAGQSQFAPALVNTGSGIVRAQQGTLWFTGNTNASSGTFLSGGRYLVSSGATLMFASDLSTLTADIEINGTGAVPSLATLNTNRGRIGLTGGADLTITPAAGTLTLEGIGDLSPGSVLTINGNAAFAGASQPLIRTEIASVASFGRIQVNGSFNLNSPGSTSRFDPDLVGGYDPPVNTTFNTITASGTITNAFDAFFGGATPSNNSLSLQRPNAQTVQVKILAGPPPAAPQILAQSYEYLTREAVVFTFNQDVSAFLSRKDYILFNTTTGQALSQDAGQLTYNALSNQATLVLTNQMPDGRYTLTVNASDIANTAGVPASGSPIVLNFHVLRGDANHDGTVNFDDLLVLAQSYGLSGRNYAQGNFNYDPAGMVDFDDLLMLSQRYGQTVLTAEPAKRRTARTTSSVLQ